MGISRVELSGKRRSSGSPKRGALGEEAGGVKGHCEQGGSRHLVDQMGARWREVRANRKKGEG